MAEFQRICDAQGCETVLATATAPLREAVNGVDLLEALRDSVHLSVRILAGPEEARLIYLGTRDHLDPDDEHPLVFDVGGGSTEFVLAAADRPPLTVSLPLGHMRLLQRAPHGNPPTLEEIQALQGRARGHLSRLRAQLSGRVQGGLYSPSGAVRTLARLAKGDPSLGPGKGDTGLTLSREDVESVKERLATTPQEEVAEWAGMDPRRCGTIACSAAIVAAVFELVDADHLTTCEGGLRTGILIDWVERIRGTVVHHPG
jgi:exopolyphosphatase/guanosine-5'-triphosphate,3'-diphosphate pyrophosphatase